MGFLSRINMLLTLVQGKILNNAIVRRADNPQLLKMSTKEAEKIIANFYSREKKSIFNEIKTTFCDMNQYDISIIVPVYNGEKYLKFCIESILNQKTCYSFEVICIDDGSTDSSSDILNYYSDDARVQIVHQSNKGISSARNHGLRISKGKYVLFVDNDDFLSECFIQTMMDYALKYEADVVKSGYKIVRKYRCYEVVESDFKVIQNGMSSELTQYNGFVWGNLIKREMFQRIEFPEGYWYEDMITRLLLYRMCKVFVYVNQSLYQYRMHGNNASYKIWNAHNYKALDQYFLAKEITDYAKEINLDFNEWTYKIYLNEFGQLLYTRTLNLEKEIRQAVFKLCSDLMCEFNENVESLCLNEGERMLNQAFKYSDFKLWELVCKYCL